MLLLFRQVHDKVAEVGDVTWGKVKNITSSVLVDAKEIGKNLSEKALEAAKNIGDNAKELGDKVIEKSKEYLGKL